LRRDSTAKRVSRRAWLDRLRNDEARANRNQPPWIASISAEIVTRAIGQGADAVVLTGSTARGARTAISDVDYWIVGDRIDALDLSLELDVRATTPELVMDRVIRGDSFTHWALREGCVLYDRGLAREAFTQIIEDYLWPDALHLNRQGHKLLAFAQAVIESGDEEAAREQVRAAVSLLTRAWLLDRGVFALARAELPRQLEDEGEPEAAAILATSIHSTPTLDELAAAVARLTDTAIAVELGTRPK
jgi:predicted nucleotidyltransferase